MEVHNVPEAADTSTFQKKENQRHSQSITEFHVWGQEIW
tara:strand:- start:533 stop:649 length:117 start_codon:yes stop_codon:yes gene_type:complete